MGKMTGDRARKPCQSDLEGVAFFCDATRRMETIRAGKLTRCQGKPRDEDDVFCSQ